MKKYIALLLCICCFFFIHSNDKVYATTKVTLIGTQVSGHDHTSYYSDIHDALNVMGYNNSEIQEWTDITRNSFLNIIDDREIIVIRSHGASCII